MAGPRIVTVAMVRDRYAGAAMARILSLVMALFLLVPTVAPAIGQGILLLASWRWIFGMLLGVGLICWAWLVLRQPETLRPEHRRPFSVGTIVRGAIEAFSNPADTRLCAGCRFDLGRLHRLFEHGASDPAGAVWPGHAVSRLFLAALALTQGAASLLNSRLVMRLGMRLLTRVAITAVILISAAFFVAAPCSRGIRRSGQ